MTVKAIFEDGMIRLLEPLPPDWTDGQELQIEAIGEQYPAELAEPWAQEMSALSSKLDRPEEWAELESALAEADSQEKARMKRRMGLPE